MRLRNFRYCLSGRRSKFLAAMARRWMSAKLHARVFQCRTERRRAAVQAPLMWDIGFCTLPTQHAADSPTSGVRVVNASHFEEQVRILLYPARVASRRCKLLRTFQRASQGDRI